MKSASQGGVSIPARRILAALVLFFVPGAMAQTTNALSDAEIQGLKLAQQLCEARPAENFTNCGTLQIRDGEGRRSKFPLKCEVVTARAGWKASYIANWWDENTNEWNSYMNIIRVEHSDRQPNRYEKQVWSEHGMKSNGVASVVFILDKNGTPTMQGAADSSATLAVAGQEIFTPFVSSDFWIADLGLEFFHWPGQKVLKKEIKRSRGCTVLESTNPDPSTNGYARVVSWIDNESGGIVQAEAYDCKNKLLKEFAPKSFKKVNGQWQLEEMEIYNDQTGSRTRLDFDLKHQ